MGNQRNSRTTHPSKSRRRERALERLSDTTKRGASNERVIAALESRIGKPPRSWPANF